MHPIRGRNATGKESGQILVLSALLMPLLLLFTGFAIDFGLGFLTKAELAKACDAASLAVMLNLGKGETQASAVGNSVFALNYNAASGLNALPPSLSITYSTDSYGEPIVNITAVATIHTFFIRLAGFSTLSVSDYSQATRPPIILSLVLDRSGSMNDNGGAAALPGSVSDFLGYFLVGTDQLGEVSFSSLATNDVPITQTFLTPINNSLSAMQFAGATFALQGLNDAYAQVTGVSNPPPHAVETVVFFTDGWANTNNDNLACNPNTPNVTTNVNYGGCSPAETQWCGTNPFFMSATTENCSGDYCPVSCNATTFPAQEPGLSNVLNITNVSDDAKYRTEQLANQMRNAGITVYSIGLGDLIDTTYLQEVANDPLSPTYNSNQPTGIAVFAPTASQLDQAFQQIAAKIVLRLTQ
jgi:hypothetical protein